MLKNYLTLAIRNVLKYRAYAAINILGLAIGIAGTLLIGLYVLNEMQVDRFHRHIDQVYRVIRATQANKGDALAYSLRTPGILGPASATALPEVQTATRLWGNGGWVTCGEKTFQMYGVLADSCAFDVFTLPLVRGDRATALRNPGSAVITESMARLFFGKADPIGQVFEVANINTAGSYTVTGVMKDLPRQSSLYIDFLCTMRSDAWIHPGWETWQPIGLGYHAETFLMVKHGADVNALTQKINALAHAHMNKEDAASMHFELQPFSEAHLYSRSKYDIRTGGDIYQVYAMLAIGGFVLLIACINFVNLATARAMLRAQEVGIRKVVGARRLQLLRQFLSESLLTVFFAMILGVCFAGLALPAFGAFVERDLSFDASQQPAMLVVLPLLWLAIGVLAGCYPAVFLSAFHPVAVLKGGAHRSSRAVWLRKGLVVFQFAMSVLLIVCTLVVRNQLAYIRTTDMGFERENVMIVPIFSEHWSAHGGMPEERLSWNAHPVEQAFLADASVRAAAAYRYSLGREKNGGGGPISQRLRLDDGREFTWPVEEVDENFLPFFGIPVVAGRNFSEARPTDRTQAMILNESAVRALGWKDPIGKVIDMGGEFGGRRTVIGVVKDFHLQSLHERIGPVMIYMNPGFYRHVALKVNMAHFPETLKFLQGVWKRYLPERPFQWDFLDDRMMGAYRAELRLEHIFNAFVGLAICIACLGLLGLAAFTAQRRTREIGIRKVLGASEPNIIALLSRDFASLVLVANILAWPFAYWAMERWLQRFVYRIDLTLWPFVLSGLLALAIASITVGYQAFKAARANPVDALRYE